MLQMVSFSAVQWVLRVATGNVSFWVLENAKRTFDDLLKSGSKPTGCVFLFFLIYITHCFGDAGLRFTFTFIAVASLYITRNIVVNYMCITRVC